MSLGIHLQDFRLFSSSLEDEQRHFVFNKRAETLLSLRQAWQSTKNKISNELFADSRFLGLEQQLGNALCETSLEILCSDLIGVAKSVSAFEEKELQTFAASVLQWVVEHAPEDSLKSQASRALRKLSGNPNSLYESAQFLAQEVGAHPVRLSLLAGMGAAGLGMRLGRLAGASWSRGLGAVGQFAAKASVGFGAELGFFSAGTRAAEALQSKSLDWSGFAIGNEILSALFLLGPMKLIHPLGHFGRATGAARYVQAGGVHFVAAASGTYASAWINHQSLTGYQVLAGATHLMLEGAVASRALATTLPGLHAAHCALEMRTYGMLRQSLNTTLSRAKTFMEQHGNSSGKGFLGAREALVAGPRQGLVTSPTLVSKKGPVQKPVLSLMTGVARSRNVYQSSTDFIRGADDGAIMALCNLVLEVCGRHRIDLPVPVRSDLEGGLLSLVRIHLEALFSPDAANGAKIRKALENYTTRFPDGFTLARELEDLSPTGFLRVGPSDLSTRRSAVPNVTGEGSKKGKLENQLPGRFDDINVGLRLSFDSELTYKEFLDTIGDHSRREALFDSLPIPDVNLRDPLEPGQVHEFCVGIISNKRPVEALVYLGIKNIDELSQGRTSYPRIAISPPVSEPNSPFAGQFRLAKTQGKQQSVILSAWLSNQFPEVWEHPPLRYTLLRDISVTFSINHYWDFLKPKELSPNALTILMTRFEKDSVFQRQVYFALNSSNPKWAWRDPGQISLVKKGRTPNEMSYYLMAEASIRPPKIPQKFAKVDGEWIDLEQRYSFEEFLEMLGNNAQREAFFDGLPLSEVDLRTPLPSGEVHEFALGLIYPAKPVEQVVYLGAKPIGELTKGRSKFSRIALLPPLTNPNVPHVGEFMLSRAYGSHRSLVSATWMRGQFPEIWQDPFLRCTMLARLAIDGKLDWNAYWDVLKRIELTPDALHRLQGRFSEDAQFRREAYFALNSMDPNWVGKNPTDFKLITPKIFGQWAITIEAS